MADVITNAGTSIMSNRMKAAGTEPNFIAWGTGTTTAAVTQTALVTPAAEARTTGTSSQVTGTVTNDTYQVVGTITCSGSGKAITEAGLFDASSAGNMLVRSDFSAINVNVGDSIAFTFKIRFVAG